MARVLLDGPETLLPGEACSALLECEADVVARAGDPFIMRFYSPVELLGGGRVLELDPPRRWRGRSADWLDVEDSSPQRSVEAVLRLAGVAGRSLDELRLASPHPIPDQLPEDWSAVLLGSRWFDPGQVVKIAGRMESWLDAAHQSSPLASGVPLESLRAASGNEGAPELIEAAVDSLVADGRIVIEGPRVRSAGHSVALDSTASRARDGLLSVLEAAGLMPPPPAELASQLGISSSVANSLLKLLIEDGLVVRLTPDLLLTAEHERSLRQAVIGVFVHTDEPAPSDFREALGVTRRYLIPLLEYLDSIGVSERSPSGRVPGPAIREAVRKQRAP
jgi:selenocysteine-specific elongation factor